jgi:hypothetical protein
MTMEQVGLGKSLKEERNHEHEDGEDDGNEGTGKGITTVGIRGFEVSSQDLNTILEIDPGNVKPKGVAGKEGYVFQEIAPCEKSRWEEGL